MVAFPYPLTALTHSIIFVKAPLRFTEYKKMAIPVEEIEKAITQLPQDQLQRFRAWYEKFDSDAWDQQIEKDIGDGKLDTLAEAALADHKAGRSRTL